MSDTSTDEAITVVSHNDADRHWIGESLARASDEEISATGVATKAGTSNFVAPADHEHKVDTGILTAFAEFNPSGNVDATTAAAFNIWLVTTTFDVPEWAIRAIIQVNLTGVFCITNVPTRYALDACISGGAVAGQFDEIEFNALNVRQSISFTVSDVSGFDTGPGQSIELYANRAAGIGQMRADAISRLSCLVTFRP